MAKKKASRGKSKVQKKAASKARPKKTQGKGVKPAKIFIYALALAALGGSGFLVYDRLKRKKLADQNQVPSGGSGETIIINNSLPVSYTSSTARTLSSGSDSFPLKRGSKGARVSMLQQALAKTNPAIKVDGQFGPKTAAALKNAGYSQTVDEILFNKIVGTSQGNLQVVFNPGALATSLYEAAQEKNLEGVLSALKQIKSVSDYASVNDYYKNQSFISKTIVTDLLEYAFKFDESAKAQIKNEFLRMGLKVDSSGTWSLQGIRLFKDLITIRETVVTDSQGNKIPVRRNTILGDEIEVANGMTWFKSIDNSILTVPTQDIKYT